MSDFPWFPRELRDASFVPRWHIIRNIKPPNLAEHSFYVTFYAMQICLLTRHHELLGDVLSYALIHDLAETFTGDIPGPTKRRIVDPEKLNTLEKNEMVARFGVNGLFATEDTKKIVKTADLIDEVMHLLTEMTLGNQSLSEVYMEAHKRLSLQIEANYPVDVQKKLTDAINSAIIDAGADRTSRIIKE